LPVEEIRPQIRTMEEYLFGLITEWKGKHNTLPLATENAWSTIEELEQLKDLREANGNSQFRLNYLYAYGERFG